MWNARLDESEAGLEIARKKKTNNNLTQADNSTVMAKNEEKLKSLLMSMKEDSEKLTWNSILKKRKRN